MKKCQTMLSKVLESEMEETGAVKLTKQKTLQHKRSRGFESDSRNEEQSFVENNNILNDKKSWETSNSFLSSDTSLIADKPFTYTPFK